VPPPPIYIPNGPPGGEYADAADRAPGVTLVFRLYAGLLAAAGLASLAAATMFVVMADGSRRSTADSLVGALFFGVVGLVFAVPSLVALFGGRRPWVHTLGLVLIIVGLLSCYGLPFSVPLLIYWVKPEVKRWYGA
jgi:hypothetical protein